jgi:hypothetical protein
VSNASEIAQRISKALPQIKDGSLVVFGDIFGGRIDNVHVVTSAVADDSHNLLTVGFADGETLAIWDPDDAIIGLGTFRIQRATKVRWEWFYYGRPAMPQNRFFIEHSSLDGRVTATTNVSWAHVTFRPSLNRQSVE